ncbi:MAG: tryptophan 2,3-dioxygenase family protein [Actinomycetota bacterium]|nr:tryptophan 2,3-dioxygenase family protein [Actinomycetota bacterium]
MEGEHRGTRRMGELSDEAGQLTYGEYLKVPELLSLQVPSSSPPAHDERLFIIVHQAYELWFSEVLYELETVRTCIDIEDLLRARHLLVRVHGIERILVEQVGTIESMSPQDFLEFRGNLNPASGFQSVQFREIEFLSGTKDPRYLNVATTEDERARLARRMDEPTLWDGFCGLLDRHGLPMPADDEDTRRTSLVKMASDRDAFGELWELSEGLLTHDELFALWRQRHILMVERQIGTKRGTGGSSGAPYLRTTLEKRFYPELWELRSHL